jgi:hypothetical protein
MLEQAISHVISVKQAKAHRIWPWQSLLLGSLSKLGFAKRAVLVYSGSSGFSLGYHELGKITLDLLKSWMTPTPTNY